MKSGNLSFLEPSRPLQACNGTPLPLHLQLQNVNGKFAKYATLLYIAHYKITFTLFCIQNGNVGPSWANSSLATVKYSFRLIIALQMLV